MKADHVDEVAKTVSSVFTKYFDVDICSVWLYNEEHEIFIRRSFNARSKSGASEAAFPVYIKLTDLIYEEPEKVIFLNATHPSPYFDSDPIYDGSEVVIPIWIDSKLSGLIIAAKNGKIQFDKDQIDTCKLLAGIFALHYKNLLKDSQPSPDKIKENIRRMQQLNERLKRSNDELQQFAYMASHDLQEPLRMISNYISLFIRNYGNSLTNDGREFLGFAEEGAQRMHNLVKDLLTFSRLDHDDETKSTFNGNYMLEEVFKNLQVAIDESEALILYQDMPHITGYENQVVRLFQNLLDNAIKFKGKKEPLIFIDVEEEKEKCEFHVKDNGIGIEPQFHEKIFGFFSRLHSKEVYKGSGLGLSICRKIVEKHHGSIGVESKQGRGSNFYFTLEKL